MKRLLFALIVPIALCSACGERGTVQSADEVQQTDWTEPPVILSAHAAAAGILVAGRAAPGARVVLRGEGGETFGVSANAEGAFEISVPRASQDRLLRPEVQVGQEATSGPDRLLIPADASAPVVVLAPGAATRRLTGAGPLSAVDSDGRALLVSGKAEPSRDVEVSAGGRSSVRARSDSDGQWVAALPFVGPEAIRVDGRQYQYPGAPSSDEIGPLIGRVDGGWRIIWRLDDGAVQSVWLPIG